MKITKDNIFDISSTGVSYYDDVLPQNETDYMKKYKNVQGKIIYLSPNEYYQACAKEVFNNTTVDRLMKQRRNDDRSLNYLTKMVEDGKQLPLTYINVCPWSLGQEGLHRMMVAGDMFGWDTKFPVLIVSPYDMNKYEDQLKQKQINKLNEVVKECLEYHYRDLDEFIYQFQYELNKKMNVYFDEDDYKFEYITDTVNNCFKINVDGITLQVDFDDIDMIEGQDESELTELDLDDEDLWISLIDEDELLK